MTRAASDPVVSTDPSGGDGALSEVPNLLRPGIWLELAKARLSALVVVTTMVGYLLAATGPIYWLHLIATLVGTTLCAWSANAFNQWLEADRDRRMVRTQARPIPSGRLTPFAAATFAVVTGMMGLTLLYLAVNALTAGLALVTIAIYVLFYTPLKTRTTVNTLVGAVCGAIPPMMGWAAASGTLTTGAWVLATVLFIWQLPHFLALAWMYREDYARGGYRMLPHADPQGRLTAAAMVLYSLALLPALTAMSLIGLTGWLTVAASLLACGWLTWLSARFQVSRSMPVARRVFLASVIILPIVLTVMVVDKRSPAEPLGPVVDAQSPPASAIPSESTDS